MSTLYENIVFLCREKGISGAKMCLDTKISKSTLTSLKTGRTKNISSENLQKIADYFGVSVDRVLGTGQKEKPVHDVGEPSVDDILDKMSYEEMLDLMAKVTQRLKDGGRK